MGKKLFIFMCQMFVQSFLKPMTQIIVFSEFSDYQSALFGNRETDF